MESVDSFEAKTHLPQLLERMAQGEEFTITRHGKPVARLVPAVPTKPKADVRQIIEELEKRLARVIPSAKASPFVI